MCVTSTGNVNSLRRDSLQDSEYLSTCSPPLDKGASSHQFLRKKFVDSAQTDDDMLHALMGSSQGVSPLCLFMNAKYSCKEELTHQGFRLQSIPEEVSAREHCKQQSSTHGWRWRLRQMLHQRSSDEEPHTIGRISPALNHADLLKDQKNLLPSDLSPCGLLSAPIRRYSPVSQDTLPLSQI